MQRSITSVILAMVVILLVSSSAKGATLIIVDSTADVIADDNTCTLREAVLNANDDFALYSSTGECPAGSGADTIQLPAGIFTLTINKSGGGQSFNGDLYITSDVEVNGEGAGLTILDGGSGAFDDRAFSVASGVVDISGMTFRNFHFSVIQNFGELALSECSLTDNQSPAYPGGIYNAGVMTIDGCSLTQNQSNYPGGAIYGISGSSLSVNDSYFYNNQAAYGGAIAVDSVTALTISNSLFRENTVSASGGALRVEDTSLATISNSTFSGNLADSHGGAIDSWDSTISMNNVTIYNNSADVDMDDFGSAGGIWKTNASVVTLANSILAGNLDLSPGGGPVVFHDCYGGAFISDGYNIIGRSSPSCTGFTDGVNGDHVGSFASPVDPGLASLADNGGPTETHMVLPGSPAINNGNPVTPGSGGSACEVADQRGVARPLGSACDIGAYEGAYIFLPLIMR